MVGFIVAVIIIGIIAGYLARAIVPGPDPMSFLQTLALGVVGSFVGGFLGYLIFDNDTEEGAFQASGIVGSILGAVVVLMIYNWTTRSGKPRRF
jgi:uncharacterized membrane protein YeaQ/YmgE (transglycosylase-associated protein family)